MRALLLLVLPTQATDFTKLDCSAKVVPADVAFYSSMLRNKEQFDIVMKSKAWAKLNELPVVQTMRKRAMEELEKPGAPLAMYRQFQKDPQNQALIELLLDMVSQEIFFVGGPQSAQFLELAGQLYGAAYVQRAINRLQGLGGDDDDPKAQLKTILDVLAEDPDLIAVPDFVIGFRLTDTNRALAQIARLEKLAGAQLDNIPELKGRLKRTKVGNNEFLTLNLDGQMVPWEKVPLKDIEDEPGQYDELVKKLKDVKLTVSLGVNGSYALLAIGENADHVAKLGPGPNRLIDRPELKPLARFADRRLTSVSYVSKELQVKLAMAEADLDDLVEMASGWLDMAELTEDQQARVEKDLEKLAGDLKKYLPQPGASLSFSFLTPQGQESYNYDWGKNETLDASKPLTLLNHVGGSPLLAVVQRNKYSPEDYQLLVKWIKVFHRYAEEFGVPKMEAEEQAKYDKFMKGAAPLFKRLDETTGNLLLPALADGQSALVLDAKLTSQQWISLLPPTETPTPMLELACVVSVSDAAKLRRAAAEYWDIAKKMLALAHQVDDNFPEIDLPEPEPKKVKDGELFTFPLPPTVPLDKKLAPTAAISEKVAVLTLSNDHAERLLANTPLKATDGPLADPKQNRAIATVFDWAGTVDALTPWIDMGVRLAAPLADPVVGDPKDLPGQVHTILDVLKVLRHYSSSTTLQDGAWVTHGVTVIQDVK
jgi:hypothetical protein